MACSTPMCSALHDSMKPSTAMHTAAGAAEPLPSAWLEVGSAAWCAPTGIVEVGSRNALFAPPGSVAGLRWTRSGTFATSMAPTKPCDANRSPAVTTKMSCEAPCMAVSSATVHGRLHALC